MTPSIRPPRAARGLLHLRDFDGHREDVAADLGELFERRAAMHGAVYARRRYWMDVLSIVFSRHAAGPGGPLEPKESSRMLASLWFDLRHALRACHRQPAFFLVAILTLAVGFAANFTAFGIVDRLLLSPPAQVKDAPRIVRLHVERADMAGGRFLWWQTPYVAYQDFRRHMRSFDMMAAYRTSRASVGSGANARMINVAYADADYFPLLGVSAALGRTFTAEDDLPPAGHNIVVLSDAYWRTAFGADPASLGRTVAIGSKTFTIVGVMPPKFTGDAAETIDAWAPLHTGSHELTNAWATHRLARSVLVLGRLAPGVAVKTAADEAAAAYRRFSDGTPGADQTALVVLGGLNPGRTQQGALTREGRIALWLQGVSILVLLVAVANVINLQMSRAAQQRRELAVRVALGASTGRLISRLALEMLLISGAGALAGAALAYSSSETLHRLLLPELPSELDLSRLGAVALAATSIATLMIVAFASLQLRSTNVSERLKSGRGGDGFSRERLRQGLLVAQVVMCAMLLAGAGLFMRSMARLDRLDFGMDNDRVLAITLPLRGAGFSNEAAETFYGRAIEELAAVPGATQVAAAQSTPFAPSQRVEIFVRGFEKLPLDARSYPTFYTVTPGFFDTMGMRVLRGRAFNDGDRAGAPPVVILEAALASKLWPNEEAIGKCIILAGRDQPCREIVGVVNNTRRFVSTPESALRYYVPMAQRVFTLPPQALFVRAGSEPNALIPAVRDALLRAAGNIPYAQIRVVRDLADPEVRPWRLGNTLFIVFGAAALFVSTLGVYALLSFIVAQRSREIGVRLALGASRGRTLRMVLRQSLLWVGIGLAVGITASLAAGRYVGPMLFETSPYDPVVFAATAGVVLIVAVVASLAPAIRATRVDPNIALRAE